MSTKIRDPEIAPSTELIPDEYDISGSKRVLFFSNYGEREKAFMDFFKSCGIELKKKNLHDLDSEKETLECLEKEATLGEKPALVFALFWGHSRNDGVFSLEDGSLPFHKIWSFFASSDNLKGVPKVFILNIFPEKKSTFVRDAAPFQKKPSVSKVNPFQAPNESDILVICKYNEDKMSSIEFIEELTKMMNENGKMEDLCSTVSITHTKDSMRPVLFSTLSKKLYMDSSQFRGNFLKMDQNFELTLRELKNIETKLEKIKVQKQPQRKRSSVSGNANPTTSAVVDKSRPRWKL